MLALGRGNLLERLLLELKLPRKIARIEAIVISIAFIQREKCYQASKGRVVVDVVLYLQNGGKDVVTSNELKEVIKILDMLDGLGTRIPTSQPSFSNNENLPRTTPATEVQQKTNSFNKIKLISEKITHSLEHLSKLVGDYSVSFIAK